MNNTDGATGSVCIADHNKPHYFSRLQKPLKLEWVECVFLKKISNFAIGKWYIYILNRKILYVAISETRAKMNRAKNKIKT